MIPAGSHPAPLDVVHADLGPEALLRHLADDHQHSVDRRMGAAVAQHTHRELHEMTTDTTDPAGLLDRLEKARQAATPGVWSVDGDENGGIAILTEPGYTVQPVVATDWGVCTDADAALIAAAVNALPELLRLARRGQALEAGVLALAEEFTTIATNAQAVARGLDQHGFYARADRNHYRADALHGAARHIRAVVAAAGDQP